MYYCGYAEGSKIFEPSPVSTAQKHVFYASGGVMHQALIKHQAPVINLTKNTFNKHHLAVAACRLIN